MEGVEVGEVARVTLARPRGEEIDGRRLMSNMAGRETGYRKVTSVRSTTISSSSPSHSAAVLHLGVIVAVVSPEGAARPKHLLGEVAHHRGREGLIHHPEETAAESRGIAGWRRRGGYKWGVGFGH